MDDRIVANIVVLVGVVVVLIILYLILLDRKAWVLTILQALTLIIFVAALGASSLIMYLILDILLIMNAGQQYFFFPDERYLLLTASFIGGLVGCVKEINLGMGWLVATAASFIVIVILLLIEFGSISLQILPSIIWVSLVAGSGASIVMHLFTLARIKTLSENAHSNEGDQEK